MASEDPDSKTEEPTPRRREEAKNDDQVPESRDINLVVVLIVVLSLSAWAVPHLFRREAAAVTEWLRLSGRFDVTPETAGLLLWPMVRELGFQAGPFMVAVLVAASAAQIAQTGYHIRWKRLKPKLDMINPTAGLKRMFSVDSLVTLVKAAVKLAFVGTVAYRIGMKVGAGSEQLVAFTLLEFLRFLGDALFRTILWITAALIVLAVFDYAYSYWKVERRLKMTKQEVKEDERAEVGDMQTKRKFFAFHQKLARNAMLKAVPEADVVLTNPVHVAVALKYDVDAMRAPQVVAKGAGALAEQIKKIARTAGVPIVERRALARALYRSVKVGQEIPEKLYRAVAEVLAYIYSLKRPKVTNGAPGDRAAT